MKVKVREASGPVLDWMVAKAEGHLEPTKYYDNMIPRVVLDMDFYCDKRPMVRLNPTPQTYYEPEYCPSADWSQGGPILTRERISRTTDHSGLWIAYWTDGYTEGDEGKKWMQCDRSELVAAMRCYVASKLGEEVEVPDELL